MLHKPHSRFSRAEIALLVIPLLVPVAVKVAAVIKEEARGRYLAWDHGIPIWRKSNCCTNGLKPINLGIQQYKQDQP